MQGAIIRNLFQVCTVVLFTLSTVLSSLPAIPTLAKDALVPTIDQPFVSTARTTEPPQPRQPSSPEIVGGKEADPGAWPWQAALIKSYSSNAYNGQFCGGTLIAPHWVLTAAHCVVNAEVQEIDVVLGRHKLSSSDGERIAVAEIIIHPAYDDWMLTSDLALLRLAQPSAQPAILIDSPTNSNAETRSLQATVTGWGLTEHGSTDELREVALPLVLLDVCNAPEAWEGWVMPNMICAGYLKGGKGSCYGDSGGPLMIPSAQEAKWIQVGVVSWGPYGCQGQNKYGVYTRVSKFAEWLQSCMADPKLSACSGGDVYEPDNNAAHATLLAADGVGQVHTLNSTTDKDWFMFQAAQGMTYMIETEALHWKVDTLLWLYASDGVTSLAFDDDSGSESQASRIIWTAPANSDAFFTVENYKSVSSLDAHYTIKVTALSVHFYLPVVSQ